MIKHLLSLTFLSLIIFSKSSLVSAQANSGWEYLNFTPGALSSVSFIDSLIGWTVGGEELLYTKDGGENWIYQDSPISKWQNMNSVFFIDEELGWIVGDKIWHTKDGGKSWIQQETEINKSIHQNFQYVYFLNEKYGWISGDSSLILRTFDGGQNWQCQSVGSEYNSIYSMYFLDSLAGWAVNRKNILKTDDSGETWYSIKAFSVDLYSVYFLDSLNGWVAGYDGKLFSTTDGGITWNENVISIGLFSSVFTSIIFTDLNNGILIGTGWDNVFNEYGLIFKTEDGGNTWNYANFDYSHRGRNAINMVTESLGYIVGTNSILKTIDGGNNWTNQISEINNVISSLYFVDENYGWAVGENFLHSTIDGGINWDTKELNRRAEDIFFLNRNIGWIVGNDLLWHTNDGGKTFSEQNAPWNFGQLQSVFCLDENTVWIVGWADPILKTEDGGNSWEAISSELYNLRKVYFIDKDYGWAAGTLWEKDTLDKSHQFGHILRTTDGGQNWQEVKTGEGHYLYSIFFIDQTSGWAIGSDSQNDTNIVLNSKDGGATWFVQAQLLSRPNDVFFIDSDNGWIATDFGEIYHTSNGGDEWTRQFLSHNYANSLNTVHFIDKNNGWAAGFDGLVINTNSGGITSISNPNIDIIPSEFHIAQNYPNPFNPTTTIQFGVPILGESINNVTLKVYDVLGREVKTLVNEQLEAGKYEIQFNAINFASGIYFYEYRVGNLRETKKMLLLR